VASPPRIPTAASRAAWAARLEPAAGQVGAIALSPFIAPGGTSNDQYNHYSLLASIEDLFGLPRLAEARLPGTTTFGADVYTNPGG